MTKQYDNYADLITFTRASTGTYLDSDGLLKTATTNTPRIEYDADGNRLGLLIEEARTNLLTYSDFDAAVPTNWSVLVDTGTFSRTLGTEIQGTPTITNVQSTDGRSFLSQSLTLSASTTYTFSCKFDPAASNISAGNSTVVAIVGLDGITSPRGLVDEIDPVTGLLTFTFTTASDVTCNIRIGVGCLADATGTLVFSQPQLEAGSFPTSYIGTAGVAATRAADVASIPTSAFGYNPDKGTVVVDFDTQFGTTVGFPRILEIGNTSTNINRIQVYVSSDAGNVLGAAFSNSVLACNINTGLQTSPASGKIAFAFSDDDFAALIDGGSPVTDTSGSFTTPSTPRNTLKIGGAGDSGSANMSGHIKSIQYFPRRLTNAQLQRLTA